MRPLTFAVVLLVLGCSSAPPRFNKDQVCSTRSLKYLRNPRNRDKVFLTDANLMKEIAATQRSMQLCYEDFRNRSGIEEFDSCMVVGIDEEGKREFFNFDSQLASLDQRFINCAKAVADSVPFEKYGRNYMVVQAYRFFLQ